MSHAESFRFSRASSRLRLHLKSTTIISIIIIILLLQSTGVIMDLLSNGPIILMRLFSRSRFQYCIARHYDEVSIQWTSLSGLQESIIMRIVRIKVSLINSNYHEQFVSKWPYLSYINQVRVLLTVCLK